MGMAEDNVDSHPKPNVAGTGMLHPEPLLFPCSPFLLLALRDSMFITRLSQVTESHFHRPVILGIKITLWAALYHWLKDGVIHPTLWAI
jgi:hypothetical protein